jgi:hypothetical protein
MSAGRRADRSPSDVAITVHGLPSFHGDDVFDLTLS